MNDDFNRVGAFHHKFGLDYVGPNSIGSLRGNSTMFTPRLIDKELIKFRLKFLREEVDELEQAYDDDDLIAVADALVDLVYVALGTAHFHMLPWNELFNEVHETNMKKARASIGHEFNYLVDPSGQDVGQDDICNFIDPLGMRCSMAKHLHSQRGSSFDVIKPLDWRAPELGRILKRFGWIKYD